MAFWTSLINRLAAALGIPSVGAHGVVLRNPADNGELWKGNGGGAALVVGAPGTPFGPSTNNHSPSFESWCKLRTTPGGVRSSKASNGWTGPVWLLVFDAITLPADGVLASRVPISIPIGQVNGDEWQGATIFAAGCIAAFSSTQPELTAILLAPIITGDGAQLSLPAVRGLSRTNSDTTTGPAAGTGHTFLYGEITIPAGNATLTLFSDAAHLVQVAQGALIGNLGGVLPVTEHLASKLSAAITIVPAAVQELAVVFEFTNGSLFDGEVV